MAAAPGVILWLLLFGPPWFVSGKPDLNLGRRFSDFKVCADEQCSMLMYRGEALQDFTGPDCRFVNFQKGDNVYVYYKLAGGSPEVWAGSVEQTFGYFPKDLIKVHEKYVEEELFIPADETDFVCFEGGRDDFDNYNVEELLGFLELEDSVPDESEKAEEVSQHREGSQKTELDPTSEPEPIKADSGEQEGAFLESTQELQEQSSAQESPHPANSAEDSPQGVQPSLDISEEMLHSKLNVPASENKTSDSSPVSVEPGNIDAYKVFKTEMTLDLKTKFGSTADALVSDDEATRLVTSLEDDLSEEPDAEYYPLEDVDNFDEIPLLSFTAEDEKVPGKPSMEKYSGDKDPNLSAEDKVEPTLPPGIQHDNKDLLTTWGDTFFSIVTGSEGKTGVDLENSNAEEDKKEAVLISASHQKKPEPTADSVDPEDKDDDPFVDLTTNTVKESQIDQELSVIGEEEAVQEPRGGLAHQESESQDAESETSPVMENNSKHESLDAALLLRDNQPDTSKGRMEVEGASITEPKVGQLEGFQNQPRFSSPEETGFSKEVGKNVPTLVRNIFGQQHKRAAAIVASRENPADEMPSQPQAIQGLQTADSPEAEEDEDPPEELLEDENAASAQQSRENHLRVPDRRSDTNSQAFAKIFFEALYPNNKEDKQATNMILETGKNSRTISGEADSMGQESGSVMADKEENHLAAERAQRPSERAQRPSEVNHLLEKMVAHTPDFQKKDPNDVQKDNPEELGNILGLVETPEGEEISEGEPEDSKELESSEESQRPDVGGLGNDPPHQATPEIPDIVLKSIREDLPIINSFFRDQKSLYRFLKYFDVHQLEGMLEDMSIRLRSVHRDSLPYNVEKVLDRVFRASESRILSVAEHMLDTRVTENRDLGTQENSAIEEAAVLDDVQDLIYFVRYQHFGAETAPLFTPPPKKEGGDGPVKEVEPPQQDNLLQKTAGVLGEQLLEQPGLLDQPVISPEQQPGLLDQPVISSEQQPGLLDQPVISPEQQPGLLDQPVISPEQQPGLLDQPKSQEQLLQQLGLLNQPVASAQLQEQAGILDQPTTGHMSASEVSQKPEKNIDPDFYVTEGSPIGAGATEKLLEAREEEPENVPPLENAPGSLYSFILYLTKMLIATLLDNVHLGPDFYGLPWQPVIVTVIVGILSFTVFSWRTILVVKNRVYQVTLKQISEKLENIKKENAELMQKLSDYEQKIKESKERVQDTNKQNMILSDEAVRYKDKIKALEEINGILGEKAKNLNLMLESEKEQSVKNQSLVQENKKSIEKLKDVILMNTSELSEIQVALSEAKLSEEIVKSECRQVQEENARLKKKKEQLQQQIEELKKSHAELTEQIKSFERSQKDLDVALTHKDDNINALNSCITQLNHLECEFKSEDRNKGGNEADELTNGELGGDRCEKTKRRIKQMMDNVSREQIAVSILEEDLKRLHLDLGTSMSTKCKLEDQIKKLEYDCGLLQTTKAELEGECKALKQKVQILNEIYCEKEIALQKKLSEEENQRKRLSAAGEKVVLAAEEVKAYKRKIAELEGQLQDIEWSYRKKISGLEKKAHDNWLKAHVAERNLSEEKLEASNLRQKLLEVSEKMALMREEAMIIKPMPGRPIRQTPPRRGLLSQNGSFGPSPVSGGECSPPLSAEPPGRPLSATLSRRDMPRSECGSLDRHLPRPRRSSETSGNHAASDPGPAPVMNSSSSYPGKAKDESKVNKTPKGPPPFPAVPLSSAPMGGPVPPPMRYGPPPPLYGPFGPRPFPPPFVPGMYPPPGIREYAPGVLPGKPDLPVDPREFLPGYAPFRPPGPLDPREYYGTPLPPPTHGPQDYRQPPPAAKDLLPSRPREEAPPAFPGSVQHHSEASKPSP